jgi:hypothetical protein
VPDYIAEDPLIKAMGVTRDQVVEALRAVGFTDDLLVRLGSTGLVARVACIYFVFGVNMERQ